MVAEPQPAPDGTHREQRLVPTETFHDLPDRYAARNDPEHC